MGRNRKPKAAHELTGAFEKHPEREAAYENAPKPEGPLGAPPASFDPEMPTGVKLIAIWHELVSQAPPGVLTSSDRLHVEMVCRLIHRIRTNTAKSGDYNTVREFLGKMAMNPADRTKVQIGGGPVPRSNDVPKADTFAQLASESPEGARPN